MRTRPGRTAIVGALFGLIVAALLSPLYSSDPTPTTVDTVGYGYVDGWGRFIATPKRSPWFVFPFIGAAAGWFYAYSRRSNQSKDELH